MNRYFERQNEPEMISLQAAQRELYSSVKRYLALSFMLTVVLPTVTSVVYLILNFFPGYIIPWLKTSLTVYGFVMLFINNLMLNHIAAIKKRAARIQEEFDTRLFSLEWNDIVAGKRPGPNEWVEPAGSYLKKSGNSSLTNWYLNTPVNLPSSVMALLCQSKNLGWDARLKQKISDILSAILALNGFVLLVLAIVINPSAVTLFSLVALLAPVYQFYYRYVGENKKSVVRADELHQKLESEMDIIAESMVLDEAHLKKLSRNIQDQIFIYRSSGNPVPDRIHRNNRERDEERYDRIFNVYEKKLESLPSAI